MIKIQINIRETFRFIKALAYVICAVLLCNSGLLFNEVKRVTIILLLGITLEIIMIYRDNSEIKLHSNK